jgi:hypothetical protein
VGGHSLILNIISTSNSRPFSERIFVTFLFMFVREGMPFEATVQSVYGSFIRQVSQDSSAAS